MNILNSFFDLSGKFFLEIGSFRITWYAFCILTGIIIAVIIGVKEAKRFGISSNFILDGVLICVPCSIIGARLYYVLFAFDEFYEEGDFGQTFLNILGFNGDSFGLSGLSITGGVIVAIIFVIIYCRKLKKNPLIVADFLAPGLLIGQICGRWGNFFNQEAHGRPISEQALSFLQYVIPPFILDRMDFYDSSLGMQAVWHPTFLYEGLWNTIGLILILVNRRKNKKLRIGDCICFYLLWYGLGRACLIEPFRMDPLMLGSLRINIIVPAIFAVSGLVLLFLKHTKFKYPFYIDLVNQYKEKRIDSIIIPLEGVLVNEKALLKNSYFYTIMEYEKRQVSEEELNKIIKINPKNYFKNNSEAHLFFLTYFKNHFSEIVKKDCPVELFKEWFKRDLIVVVTTKYSKEFADYVLSLCKIQTFVSVIISNDITEDNLLSKGKEWLSNYKNTLAICSSLEDIKAANKLPVIICDYGNFETKESKTDYTVYKLNDLMDIMV